MFLRQGCILFAIYILWLTEGKDVKSEFVNAPNTEKLENPIVSTPLGKIKGSLLTSRLGKTIYSFRGIRYAKAPVNDLRFKPPVPVEKWEKTYDATKDGVYCPQPVDEDEPSSEDCLIVNVYSTKLPTGDKYIKRPVIVYIHAGGFYSVTSVSTWAGPEYFMDQDIVLVTFNYRLATLGFLSTGTKEAPGNNGMKDQVEVLKWVKNNIASFGGNPDSVTLLGYSAGSFSIILHMLSPMSKGLFHKGIAMSGSPLGVWPIPNNQQELARKQARLVGCPEYNTMVNIVECLKTVSYQDLGNSLNKFEEFGTDPILIWSPVIEPDFGQPRFLTDHPIRLIERGEFMHVPLIIGRNIEEFSYHASYVFRNQTLTREIDNEFKKIAPIAFLYERDTNFSRYVSQNLRQFYFQNRSIDNSTEQPLKDLYEDSIEGFPVDRAAKLISQRNTQPVYYYHFSYQGTYSHVYKEGTNNTIPYGVVHHDDLIYLFYISKLFPLFEKHSPEDVEMVNTLTSLYANFAKFGNPTPSSSKIFGNTKWEPYNLKELKYMDIGKQLVMKQRLHQN